MLDYNYTDYGLFEGSDDGGRLAHEGFLRFRRVFVPSVYAPVFACGLVGNALVLLIYFVYQKLKSLTDVFLVNLPLADLVFVCTLPFWAYTGFHEWVFGKVMCQVVLGIYTVNLYTSMLILVCITVDRFLAVVRATRAYGQRAKQMGRGKAICLSVWVACLLVSLPQILLGDVHCRDRCICTHSVPTKVLAAQTALGFFLPLLVMAACYSVIAVTLLRARRFQKRKSLKIILLLVAVFLLTQTPFNLVQLVGWARWEYHTMTSFHYAVVVTEAISFLRVCLNPVLYGFIGLKFRKNFWKLVKDIGCLPYLGASSQRKCSEDTSKTCSASHHGEATSMSRL